MVEFVRAGRMSYDYQRILAVGITRNIVATKAENASTRTVGTLLEAFAFNLLGRGADGPLDRILNAPTNEAWIDPWVTCLKSLGVEFRIGWTVRDLTLDAGRIAAVVIEDPGVPAGPSPPTTTSRPCRSNTPAAPGTPPCVPPIPNWPSATGWRRTG